MHCVTSAAPKPQEVPAAKSPIIAAQEASTQLWKLKQHWYQHQPNWDYTLLLPQIRYWRTSKKSLHTLFSAQQRSLLFNYQQLEKWEKEAAQLVEQYESLSRKQYLVRAVALRNRYQKINETLPAEASLPAQFPVSFRGLVNKPSTILVEKGTSLTEAIHSMGGLHKLGMMSRIAVYRNGNRSVYNLTVPSHPKVTLYPCDMVVALGSEFQDRNNPSFIDDPFVEPDMIKIDRPTKGSFYVEKSMPSYLKVSDVHPDYIYEFWNNERIARYGPYVLNTANPDDAIPMIGSYTSPASHPTPLAKNVYSLFQAADWKQAETLLTKNYANHPPEWIIQNWRLQRLRKQAIELSHFQQWFDFLKNSKCDASDTAQLTNLLIGEMHTQKIPFPKSLSSKKLDWLREAPLNQHFPSDLKIVVFNSSCLPGSHLTVTDPLLISSDMTEASIMSGRLSISSSFAEEYMLRFAIPGRYTLKLSNKHKTTYQLEIYLDWGKPSQSMQMLTIQADGTGGIIDAGFIDFKIK
ncbi:hypothetical protein [Rubritalea tangerina]